MKTLIRTIIVLCTVNLMAAGSALAGNVAAESALAESVQQQTVSVQPTPPSIRRNMNVLLGSRTSDMSGVLVIPSAQITAQEIATITEDMNIMSRIFEKNLQEARINVDSMFIPHMDPFMVALGRGRQPTQGMYLQGYGALFLMKVDFPLSPGPQQKEEKETETKNADVDPVWTQTKQQIYEPEESRRQSKDRPVEEYDAEKVENLKTTLVKSLKHAANIRSLKPDESVILTVTGSGGRSGVKSIRVVEQNKVVMIDDKNTTRVLEAGVSDDALSLPTILVIRAKKSDIDRFAKGDLDLAQFQQNTQILSCAYLTSEGGAANPFNGSYFYPMTSR